VISQSWPLVASYGMLNAAISNQHDKPPSISGSEGQGSNAKNTFVWGANRWGGSSVTGV